MDQVNDQQQQPESSAVAPTASGIRTLRPPGTVRKPPSSSSTQNTRLTSYMAQNRFRLLNPVATSTTVTNSGTILRPLQRLQQQTESLNQTHYQIQSSRTTNTVESDTAVSSTNPTTVHNQPNQPQRVAVSTSRIPPAGTSGLARPTPLQRIAIATGSKTPYKDASSNIAVMKSSLTTTRNNQFSGSAQLRPSNILASQKSPSQALSGSHSKLTSMQLRPRTATTLVRPKGQGTIKSTTMEKRKEGPIRSEETDVPPPPPPSSEPRFRSQSNVKHVASPSVTEQTGSQKNDGPEPYLIDLSSVENDVGEIRRLLEQLLCLLQMAHQDQDKKERENEKLRQEVRELKSKIRSIRSTVAANADSEPPTPSLPQHVQYRQHYDLQEESPPTDGDVRNEGFTTEHCIHDATISAGGYRNESEAVDEGQHRQHQQSAYFSPLN